MLFSFSEIEAQLQGLSDRASQNVVEAQEDCYGRSNVFYTFWLSLKLFF